MSPRNIARADTAAGHRFRLLAVGTLVAVSGCGSATSDAASNATPDSAGRGSTVESIASSSGLAGRWAHYDVVAYQDKTMRTLIISYGFTDFEVDGNALREQESFCHADQRSDQAIETSISDAATQAIVPVEATADLTSTPTGLRIQRPATPTPVGIRLEDPANDKLPTDRSDPRIVDDDHDGQPGITVHVKVGDAFEGDLYLARREIFAYDMTQDGPDTLTGTVEDHSEQLVIGASNEVLAATAQWVQHPDLTRSPIILRRVGADWDCDRLMAERDQLFPAAPTTDW